ncbi:ZIP family metal transporter [Marinoscillum furvescens]|uniref:Zinc transporter ZupT n=1 Tax=Marinoscillum furvescens DSM 4134 TaxID=1122208 RepID=A0A3D9LJV3_MARFU|nr:zinc permease [Marinoscillum furvescens]REE05926.1 hypothetical protein C7460_101445 [Marinoscillum furvescens DSM 4134]
MILIFSVLFLSALLGGVAARYVNGGTSIRYPLIFAGSFLFSITIIHILPEVFTLSANPMKIGLYVLFGFFFQQLLEYFTSGIEHGHAHAQEDMSVGGRLGLLVALVIHSFLEGALLTHDSPFHDHHDSHSVLIGIVLHKVPAAFALVTTFKNGAKVSAGLWVILLVFSLSSPLGFLLSDQVLHMSSDQLVILFAFVSGSFLHISTTIFVETSPNHHFGLKKFLVSVLGAGLAIVAEHML